jgi:S1-C subfamily serine protease
MSRVLPAALAGGIAGAGLLAVVLALAGVFEDPEPPKPPKPEPKPLTIAQVYARVRGAMVSVRAVGVGRPNQRPPFGPPEQSPREATGAGFVIRPDGTIVTNAHVVGRSDRVVVRFRDRGEPTRATTIGRSVKYDLAVLKIDPPPNLRAVPLGDSSRVKTGDTALAIGNPYGLSRTLTVGVIAQVGRDIDRPDGFDVDDAIQTDAPLNPGNSGGPLLNARGQVIGVTTQARNEDIGFAVPSNTVKELLTRLKVD